MSLLNDMLRDIEKSEQKNAKINATAVGSSIKLNGYQLRRYGQLFLRAFIVVNLFLMSVIVYKRIFVYRPLEVRQIALPKKKTKKYAPKPVVILKSHIVPIGTLRKKIVITKKTKVMKTFLPLSQRQQSEMNYQKALEFIDNNELKKAQTTLGHIVQNDAYFAKAVIRLIELEFSLNDEENAVALLNKGLARFPRNIDLIRYKANHLLSNTYYQEALRLLNQESPDISKEPAYYALKAVVYEKLGQFKDSGELYHLLLRIDPSNGLYWFGYGVSLERQNQFNQAVSAYSHVLDSYQVPPVILSFAKRRIAQLRG